MKSLIKPSHTSSTEVRKLIQDGSFDKLNEFLHPSVVSYIKIKLDEIFF